MSFVFPWGGIHRTINMMHKKDTKEILDIDLDDIDLDDNDRLAADEISFFKTLMTVCIIVPAVLFSMVLLYVPKGVRKATPKATKDILTAAHTDAIKTANSLNLADYELIPPETAKRDSARYARHINRFVKYHGEDYLVRHNPYPYDKQYYIHTSSLYHYEPKMQKLVGKYENTIQQLEMNRRYQRQKH